MVIYAMLFYFMVIKNLNDTMGRVGVVSSALVFGECPSTRVFSEPPMARATLQARAVIATEERRAMEQDMAGLRVHQALRHQVPTAADVTLEVGDNVLVWRERVIADHIGEWAGSLSAVPLIVKKSDSCTSEIKNQRTHLSRSE